MSDRDLFTDVLHIYSATDVFITIDPARLKAELEEENLVPPFVPFVIIVRPSLLTRRWPQYRPTSHVMAAFNTVSV